MPFFTHCTYNCAHKSKKACPLQGLVSQYNSPVTVPWDALAAPFAASDLLWRVVKLSPDRLSAQVRPQLRASSVTARLDAVLGVDGWSQEFTALGERGLVCTLRVADAAKAAVVPYTAEAELTDTAADAFAAAAALFGLRPNTLLDELPWVDYDPEQRQPLYEPDLAAADGYTNGYTDSYTAPANADSPTGSAPPTPPTAASAEAQTATQAEPIPAKSAGQQAIDKLVDRLKADGKGLGAAKLLNTYGGYGTDPAAARELYAKLRALLLEPA